MNFLTPLSLLKKAILLWIGIGLGGLFVGATPTKELLHVSFDPTRELFAEYNVTFTQQWKEKTRERVIIHQSHGGSGKQARSVVDGLRADIVSLALGYDIDLIQERSGLISSGWQNRYPENSSPYYSTIVFLVRKGNPKNIQNWGDLLRNGIEVITPNPKTSGGARWNYLAAWGYAIQKFQGDEGKTREFVTQIYRNVPILDAGARGAAVTFTERLIGDVLITWENEAYLAKKSKPGGEFEIVIPEMTILAEPPVALVEKNVMGKGNKAVADAYILGLYSEESQEMMARHYFRPRLASVAEKYRDRFPEVKMFTLKELFKDWKTAHQRHFASDALFDQIFTAGF